MNQPRQEPGSISLRQMDALPRFEQVVALGRQLVEELRKEPPVDTLARWMAHYIAELIDAAENGPTEERAVARKKCFEAILQLWSHRAALPDGRRPFENLEPIARTIESLDPDNDVPRHYRSVRRTVDRDEESSHTQSILDFADKLDAISRILIRWTLADAARSAVDDSKEWIALAKGAGTRPGFEQQLTSLVVAGIDDGEQSDPTEAERNSLSNHVERLEVFTDVAAKLTNGLKARLNALSSSSLAERGSNEGAD